MLNEESTQSTPYEDRLIAIHGMLNDLSHEEIVQEGYDSLFRLWLETSDSPDFIRRLRAVAVEHSDTLKEFERRINELVIREGITDLYLRIRLKTLTSKVAQTDPDPSINTEGLTKHRPSEMNVTEKSNQEDGNEKMRLHTKKIFISYSHKDEKYKDELVNMLTPLQDQGLLSIWQDREIVAGDEWYQAIQDAMNTCDLALLLISGDFLASRFIRDEELSRLLQRRKDEGLRLVPIIIRACMWQSVPVLKDLQALPKDGRPVVSFERTGKRDWVWTQIAMAIKNLC